MAPATHVTLVTTVYGDCFYVSTSDLNGTRIKHQLPIYTRGGKRFADTPRGISAAKRGEATTLARGNIAYAESRA